MEITTYQGIGVAQPSGALVGNAAAEKVGFHGITPCIQASAITSPGTTGATTTSGIWGFTTSTQANALTVAVDSIITALLNKGILAGGTTVTLR
jgi:hypothetical protein